ncbi:MAG: ribose-5-phosphate isomerase RpiA [Phycisphaerae bacterium]|nr:ribose-5-phosphate isomerase RpiA [Phycisphaerae bacterium]
MLPDAEQHDALAALAIEPIRSGMVVGLGTGRAAQRAVRALAARVRAEAMRIRCVSTSEATTRLAASLGLMIEDFSGIERVEYLFDGADEVDPCLRMIKGGGGAMTRERIVAHASVARVNLVDEGKMVPRLGVRCPLPVEVLPMAFASVRSRLLAWGFAAEPRAARDGSAADAAGRFLTDNGNLILDARLPETDIEALAARLDETAGVVDHGLFLHEAQAVLVESAAGVVTRHVRTA